MKHRKRVRIGLKWLLGFIVSVTVLIGLLIIGFILQQELVVQQLLNYTNQNYQGIVTLEGSHIDPFANFPYVSIDFEGLKIYETKDTSQAPIVDVQDAFMGFDIWTILKGRYDLKSIYLRDGYAKIVQYEDGSLNIVDVFNPLKSIPKEIIEEDEPPFELDLSSIKLHQVDVHKLNEVTTLDIDAYFQDAQAIIRVNGVHTMIDLDARYTMNFILDGDTSFVKNKHFDIDTQIEYDSERQFLSLSSSAIKLEQGKFQLEGTLDIANDQYIDLNINGAKPNFDLIIAFAPDALIPTLQSYDNKGDVFFKATVQGKLAQGAIPQINAEFGCKQGSIENSSTKSQLGDMEFKGYFRNTSGDGGLRFMEFGLQDFKARPETGQFYGDLAVRNFVSPDIALKVKSQFDLDFLVDFLNLRGLSDMSGSVNLTMNFHDIIDLNKPEKSIEQLNESYFTKLEIRDLHFKSQAFHLPIEGVNIIGHIEGHEAKIDTLSARVGNSDIFASARISDLPAIFHHTQDSLWVDLQVNSNFLDIAELTYDPSTQQSALDEQIQDLRLDVGFESSAFALTESPNLPVGEFFIQELHANLKHYPHELHDFKADVLIEDEDMRLVDFSGELDSSDFHFSGRLVHYDIWLNEVLDGDTEFEFDLNSQRLKLEDLLVYQGENYVPEDYRHEEFDDLILKGRTLLHFKDHAFYSMDMYLDQLACTMKMHNSRFERFQGRIHYEDQHVSTQDLRGQIGRSDLQVNLYWYLGDDPKLKKTDHFIRLNAKFLDMNQLLAWNPPPSQASQAQALDHDAGFSVFNLPFWDMRLKAQVGQLVYHQYKIQNLDASARMRAERYIDIDTCFMQVAGGDFDISGYFDARDSTDIYFSPDIYVENLDIDRFLIKFDNFGQDYVVSDNLHGKISGDISGKLHIHKDLTPMIDKSNFTMNMQVVQGRLDNYQAMEYLENYFKNKNLKKIRFDTLTNTFEIKDNVLHIPVMTINSSLGFIELWGKQNLGGDLDTDLFVKVPLKIITRAIFQKLFKRKREDIDPEQEDAIEYQDQDKKIAYVHVNLLANSQGYEVKLKKDKDLKREQVKQRLAEKRAKRKAKKEAKYKARKES